MKTLGAKDFLILVLVAVGAARAADESVVSQAKRQEVLSAAKALLTPTSSVTMTKDPFHSEDIPGDIAPPPDPNNTNKPPPQTGPRNARELLQAIASSPSLKPSGVFTIGGGQVLLFGQKRVKAGGVLNITFEGAEYALEIVSIAPPNFTLRLNREEFTRPIK